MNLKTILGGFTMNKCGFLGRMGSTAKFFPSNGNKKAFMTFSLAVKRPGGLKDENGNIVTDWMDFNAFGKTAELIDKFCPKGSMVLIDDCTAIKDKFTDSQGNDRQAVKFNVNRVCLDVTFASSDNKGEGNSSSRGSNNSRTNTNDDFGFDPTETEDMPF